MNIPGPLLRKLYTVGSLRNTDTGAQFALKNRLTDVEVVSLDRLAIDGGAVALDQVRLGLSNQRFLLPSQVDHAHIYAATQIYDLHAPIVGGHQGALGGGQWN